MITGINTDISFNGATYHVQTEDKGRLNPIIESLVYMRGAILVAKRTSYAKELENGLPEERLQAMLEKQHRTILAVINAGRIQELVEKLGKPRKEELTTYSPPPTPPLPPTLPEVLPHILTKDPPANLPSSVISKSESQPLFAEFDLDKIIFDYLQTDAEEEKVEIRLHGNTDFYAGDVVILQIEVVRGKTQPLAGIPIIVKIIGTSFKPQIYSGRTGPDGIAVMPVVLPNFTAGSAAVVVQSSSEVGDAEVKHLIRRR